MKIALFLGAGASVEFGKPTTSQMRERLLKKYTNNTLHDDLFHSLLAVPKFKDIEYILSAIEQLDEFSDSLGHEFFTELIRSHGNHQMTGFRGNGYTYNQIMSQLNDIYKTIQAEVFHNYSWEHDYDSSLQSIYNSIFGILKKYTKDALHVFTTNYDRAVEEYCSDPNKRLRCIDGFKLDSTSGRFRWQKGDFGYAGHNPDGSDLFLYKIHGSLDWKKHKIYGIVKTGEESISGSANYEYNLLVYPTLSPKDGFEKEPYRSIRKKFDEFMSDADVCVTIGYSFRDDHVNDIFKKFLEKEKRMIIISPTATKNFLENLQGEEVEDLDDAEIRGLMLGYPTTHSINTALTVANLQSISSQLDKAIIDHGF